jgi:hypothetical protein
MPKKKTQEPKPKTRKELANEPCLYKIVEGRLVCQHAKTATERGHSIIEAWSGRFEQVVIPELKKRGMYDGE